MTGIEWTEVTWNPPAHTDARHIDHEIREGKKP